MKKSSLLILVGAFLFLNSCASIPKETVVLSKTIGTDIEGLHESHRQAIEMQFDNMEEEINSFIKEVYTPFVIHFVLKRELETKEEGGPSLFGSLEAAAKDGRKEVTQDAVKDMEDFLSAAYEQIDARRRDLLQPIRQQRMEVLNALNESYNNISFANATVTGYLESIREVKDAQNEALTIIGVENLRGDIREQLVNTSELISEAVKKGREIDIKSDDALIKLKKVFQEIKDIKTK